MYKNQDYITPDSASTLSDLFYERVNRSANRIAYSYFDDGWEDLTWKDIEKKVELWHSAFRNEGLVQGDRVAIMMNNSPDWVIFDQAAYSLGLVVVPIYTNDRTENIRYILENSNVKIFFIQDPTYCKSLLNDSNEQPELKDLIRIVSKIKAPEHNNPRLVHV